MVAGVVGAVIVVGAMVGSRGRPLARPASSAAVQSVEPSPPAVEPSPPAVEPLAASCGLRPGAPARRGAACGPERRAFGTARAGTSKAGEPHRPNLIRPGGARRQCATCSPIRSPISLNRHVLPFLLSIRRKPGAAVERSVRAGRVDAGRSLSARSTSGPEEGLAARARGLLARSWGTEGELRHRRAAGTERASSRSSATQPSTWTLRCGTSPTSSPRPTRESASKRQRRARARRYWPSASARASPERNHRRRITRGARTARRRGLPRAGQAPGQGCARRLRRGRSRGRSEGRARGAYRAEARQAAAGAGCQRSGGRLAFRADGRGGG